MTTTPTFWGTPQVTFSSDPLAGAPDVAGLQDNSFVIVWQDQLAEVHGRQLDSLGSFTKGDFLNAMSAATAQDLRLPEVVQQGDGLVRVFFQLLAGKADEDIYVNYPTADFTPNPAKLDVLKFAIDEFKRDAAASEFNNAPDTVIVFSQPRPSTSGRSDPYFVHLAQNSLPIGSPQYIPLNTDETLVDASVAGLGNGNTVIAYQAFDTKTSTQTVRYRIYDDYTDISGALNASSSPGNDVFPAVTGLKRASDGFVIATQDALGLRYLYSAFGNKFTASVPGSLGDGKAGFTKAINPQITALEDQGFIIAWTDTSEIEGDGSPDLQVVLQRFGSNGSSIGSNLFIDAPGDQSLSSIATLDDGRVVLAYTSETGDSTNVTTLNYQIVDPRDPTIFGSGKADNIVSREDGATMFGFEDNDVLIGRAASDVLNGGTGADKMTGSFGNDVYHVDDLGDVIFEFAGEGTADKLRAEASYVLGAGVQVEVMTTILDTATTAIDLTGNTLQQDITANAGTNVLSDGGAGAADVLRGLGGNDTYRVYNAADVIEETASQGTADIVNAAVSYALGAGVHIETLRTNSGSATTAINLTGNALKQDIVGNAGANELSDGGAGASDSLRGLGGNDTYRVFNTGDTIVEGAGLGTADKVVAAVSYALGTGVHVETLQTSSGAGTSAINLYGNEFAQSIAGNNGANRIDGKGGADTLRGLGGADTFVFGTKLAGGNTDTIVDFNPAADRFLLSDAIFTALTPGTITAAAFRANTTGEARDATDRIVYDIDSGGIFYDADGLGGVAGVRFAIVSTGLAITNADFDVV